MKRFFVLFIGLIGLGVVMSGCVANTMRTTFVKDKYIEKNYIDKVKVPKSKKVGDKNIKFYVGKVEDKRDDKGIVIKRMAFGIRTGDTEFANPELTIRNITEKALFNTGWGVVGNRSNADFVVDTELKDFATHFGILSSPKVTESNVCILGKNDEKVVEKRIYKETHGLFATDFTARFRFIVGDMSVQYYSALLDYFSSPAFVDAIKKAYAEMTDIKISKK